MVTDLQENIVCLEQMNNHHNITKAFLISSRRDLNKQNNQLTQRKKPREKVARASPATTRVRACTERACERAEL